MSVFIVLIGSLVPAAIGWLLLDLLEGKVRVLSAMEKWAGGFLLGQTFAMFSVFILHETTGITLTLWTYLETFAVLIMILLIPWLQKRKKACEIVVKNADSPKVNFWLQSGLLAFSGWVLMRILTFTVLLFTTPTFYDDTLDNWNLRGKVFFVDQKITLLFPWSSDASGVSSYPPTVPLMKAWLANLGGGWSEGLVNGIHVLWFIALLALVYSTLRRVTSWQWSLLGTTLLASLPLEFMQGVGTYADIFVSAHIFIPVAMLFAGLRSTQPQATSACLRIAAVAITLVPFTKNEGWALYFPILVFLFTGTLAWLARSKTLSLKTTLESALWLLMSTLLLCAPWIIFKMINGLTFGNAKGIDLAFSWQPRVLTSIIVNTFFEANWAFLFPLAIGLCIAKWRSLLRPDLLLLFLAFLLPYGVQHVAYFFTGLSQEAIFQTGYARGIVHIVPMLVVLTTLLLERTLSLTERQER